MHTIYIRDLHISATHGYYSFEKETSQTFIVSITVHLSAWSSTDSLTETLNYESLREIAIVTLSRSPKNLLETLVDEIAEKILLFPKVQSVFVSLEKPDIFPDCVAGVSILKEKSHLAQEQKMISIPRHIKMKVTQHEA